MDCALAVGLCGELVTLFQHSARDARVIKISGDAGRVR
jgi:hypothetical protein